MRQSFLLISLFLCIAPIGALAASPRVVEDWQFTSQDDITSWNYTAIEEVLLTSKGVQFDVENQAVMYRPLPENFLERTDLMEIHYDATGLDEVAFLFLTLDAKGEITRRVRLPFAVDAGKEKPLLLSLQPYRAEFAGAELFAVSFQGTAQGVTFGEIRFLHFSLWDKIASAWDSFLFREPFLPFTINIIHGPTIDANPLAVRDASQHTTALSVNAPLLVGLSIFGFALLFFGWFRAWRGEKWGMIRRRALLLFFGAVAVVWLLYDLRMGTEFILNVAQDQKEFVQALPAEKTFRDLGRFPSFVAFAKPFLQNVQTYEVLLTEQWPYYGMLRYETYPARPNLDAPVSDVWLIYDRPDVTINAAGQLMSDGAPFTESGELLGRFDASSFLYRAQPLPSS